MLFFEITNRRANFLKKQFHNWSKFVAVQTNSLPGTVVLAQLVERLVRIQSLAKIYLYWTFFTVNCVLKSVANPVSMFFLNGPFPASFCLFSSFQTNKQFLQQIYVKKCPSCVQCWDSNPQPSDHESPPITTRPGLPPFCVNILSLFG